METPYNRLIKQFTTRRYELHKTQVDLEGELGTTDKQMDKWERMIRRPTLFNAVCWAEGLNCDLVLVERADVRKEKE